MLFPEERAYVRINNGTYHAPYDIVDRCCNFEWMNTAERPAEVHGWIDANDENVLSIRVITPRDKSKKPPEERTLQDEFGKILLQCKIRKNKGGSYTVKISCDGEEMTKTVKDCKRFEPVATQQLFYTDWPEAVYYRYHGCEIDYDGLYGYVEQQKAIARAYEDGFENLPDRWMSYQDEKYYE